MECGQEFKRNKLVAVVDTARETFQSAIIASRPDLCKLEKTWWRDDKSEKLCEITISGSLNPTDFIVQAYIEKDGECWQRYWKVRRGIIKVHSQIEVLQKGVRLAILTTACFNFYGEGTVLRLHKSDTGVIPFFPEGVTIAGPYFYHVHNPDNPRCDCNYCSTHVAHIHTNH